jgi:hypothetical protein
VYTCNAFTKIESLIMALTGKLTWSSHRENEREEFKLRQAVCRHVHLWSRPRNSPCIWFKYFRNKARNFVTGKFILSP